MMTLSLIINIKMTWNPSNSQKLIWENRNNKLDPKTVVNKISKNNNHKTLHKNQLKQKLKLFKNKENRLKDLGLRL